MLAAIGVVFYASATLAFAQNEHAIYQFKGGTDGDSPYATLTTDATGNLYGTTSLGGSNPSCTQYCGTVFQLTPPLSGGQWNESVLYRFTRGADGGEPVGGVIFDAAGNLYGTTTTGGAHANGTIFQLAPPAVAGAPWTLTTLYDFTSFNNGFPTYLLFDTLGNLYGEEPAGGNTGWGAIFQLTPPAEPGGAWAHHQIFSFDNALNGVLPIGSLLLSKGNLYGMTAIGGINNCAGYGCGTIFELVAPAAPGGPWAQKVLYRFTDLNDAHDPYDGLLLAADGNLYGTTAQGGAFGQLYGGYGTVFRLAPPTVPGGAWTETILYSFQHLADGHGPVDKLLRDESGNLYGTTNAPTVFELSPPAVAGGTWTETTLYDFTGRGDGGGYAFAGLVSRNGRGLLFGATTAGGVANKGVVYSVTR